MKKNMLRELTTEELEQLHQCLLCILKDFIEICNKYNLKYTLGGGSVLGAVRHKGFIPWDDDLDINMPRADYEKFKEIFSQELSAEYDLRVPNSQYGSSTLFMKLLKKDTTYEQQFFYGNEEPANVWVDIFPFDNVSENKIARTIKGFLCNVMAYAFVSRFIYEHRNQSTDEYYSTIKNGYIYKARLLIARCLPVHFTKLYNFFDRFVRHADTTSIITCATGRKHYLGECINSRYFSEAEDGIFEGIHVKLPYDYKQYLSQLYGNYMEIPPVEKREHHFTRNFAINDCIKFKIDKQID